MSETVSDIQNASFEETPMYNPELNYFRESDDKGNDDWIDSVDSDTEELFFTIKSLIDPVKDQIQDTIYSINLTPHMIKEGLNPPTLRSKELAEKIALNIYNNYQLYPHRVSASVEEGLFLYYRNFSNNMELSIEVYNDLDIAALINLNNEIVDAFDIDKDYLNDYMFNIMEIFYS